MAKFQPTSVSNVCEEKHQFLVLPAIGQELLKDQLTDSARNVCRVFIMRVDKQSQLGKYQQADVEATAGTLYLELDKQQFKKASTLLLNARENALPAIEWRLDSDDVVAALVIGSTQFHCKRLSDIRELLEGAKPEEGLRSSGGSSIS